MLFILTGPTCSGKTYARDVLALLDIKKLISYTTREPRDGEIYGMDYYFVTGKEFHKLQSEGIMRESAVHLGNYYGSPNPSPEENSVLILEPKGVRDYIKNYKHPYHIIRLKSEPNLTKKKLEEKFKDDKETLNSRLQNIKDYNNLLDNLLKHNKHTTPIENNFDSDFEINIKRLATELLERGENYSETPSKKS